MFSQGFLVLALLSFGPHGLAGCRIHQADDVIGGVATIAADSFCLDRIPRENTNHPYRKAGCAWLDDVEKSSPFLSRCSEVPGYFVSASVASTSLQSRAKRQSDPPTRIGRALRISVRVVDVIRRPRASRRRSSSAEVRPSNGESMRP